MTDIATAKEELRGMELHLKDLKAKRDKHVERSGIDKQIASLEKQLQDLEVDLQSEKEEYNELAQHKSVAVKQCEEKLRERLNTVLPQGSVRIEVDDNKALQIYWNDVHYSALSGGEKVQFDQALSHAFLKDAKNKIVIVEGSELDDEHMGLWMDHIKNNIDEDTQYFVATCHAISEIPSVWNIIEV